MEPVQADVAGAESTGMEIVVRGRNVVVPDHYRQHVTEKLAKLERYDAKISRVDVELHHERNPRQQELSQQVQITCRTRGPVVRSEARAEDFYKALEKAADRLERRLRHAADRRRVHHGRRRPTSVTEATAAAQVMADLAEAPESHESGEQADSLYDDGSGPGRIVREKEHPGAPMSVNDALERMELVGHDFYLFNDVATGRPSVVYRRRAFDYGIIRLAQGG